jgi:hemolysin activation/secretion protein
VASHEESDPKRLIAKSEMTPQGTIRKPRLYATSACKAWLRKILSVFTVCCWCDAAVLCLASEIDLDSAEHVCSLSDVDSTISEQELLADPLVQIEHVKYWGRSAISELELTAHVTPFLKRSMRRIEFEQLRQSVSQLYMSRGYVSSGAVLPPQQYDHEGHLKHGTLHLCLIEGRNLKIDVQNLNAKSTMQLSNSYILSRIRSANEIVHAPVIEERLRLLLADNDMFANIRANLAGGDRPGEANLRVDVVLPPSPPMGIDVLTSNYQAPAVGSTFGGVRAWMRNLTTWGDNLSVGAQSSRGANHYDVAWTVPIFARPTTLNLRWAKGASSVIEEPLTSLNIDSDVETGEVGISHPVITRAKRQLILGVTYGERRNRTTLDGEPFSFVAGEQTGETIARDWRFHQDLVQRFDNHVFSFRSTFVWGATNVAKPQLVPGQPSRNFFVWTGQANSVSTMFDGKADLVLTGAIQWARDALVPIEKYSIGGRYSVRGYRENQLVRDRGYFTSAELQIPFQSSENYRIALVPFLDIGAGANRDDSQERLASVGIGLKGHFKTAFGVLDGECFYGKRLRNLSVDTHGDLQDRGVHFEIRYRYKR